MCDGSAGARDAVVGRLVSLVHPGWLWRASVVFGSSGSETRIDGLVEKAGDGLMMAGDGG